MRKITAVILSVVLCLTLLCACGRKTDSDGNTLITSRWTCISYTVNGTHEDLRDDSILLKLIMFKDKPRFKSTDGTDFTLSLLQKEYNGTLTLQEDGTYIMSNGEGKPTLNAKISGNVLSVYDDNGKIEINFETS